MTRRWVMRPRVASCLAGLAAAGVLSTGAMMAGGGGVAEAATATPALAVSPSLSGHPVRNGETVSISVGPNSFFDPYSRIEIMECAAPGGQLPTSDLVCDGVTTEVTPVSVNADGSFQLPYYTLLSLPTPVYAENPRGTPVCNLTNACVLYVGEDQNDFSRPKIFSAPFTIDPSYPAPAIFPGSRGAGPTGSPANAAGGSGPTAAEAAQADRAPGGSSGRHPTSAPAAAVLPESTGRQPDEGLVWPWVVAGALVVALLVALGVAIGRRRQPEETATT